MGGSNKTQTQTQSQTSGPAQYIQDAYKSLVGQAQGVANASYDPATGKQIAGLTGNQNQGIAGVQNNQGSYQPYLQNAASSAAAGVAPVSTQSILDNYNPFVQAQVDALQANLGQQNAQTLQQVNSNAAKIGALTGDRSQIAAQQATNDNNRNAATAMAGLQSQAFGQAANLAQGNQSAALQGANVYSNLGTMAQNAGYNDANALLGVGGLQQTQQQNVLDANSQNAQAQAAYPYQNLQWLAGILGNAGAGSGQTTTGSTSTPGPNMWSQVLGAGLAGASLLSDERAKEGIAPIGKMFDGTPIYKFNYKGDNATQIGVMAQDIEKRKPEAVSEGSGGLKSVNYDIATRDAAERGRYAGGGGVPYGGAPSYIPQMDASPSRGMSAMPSLGQASGPQTAHGGMGDLISSFKQARGAFEGLGNLGQSMRTTTDPSSGWSTTVNPSGAGGWGNYLSSMFSKGGGVRGYDDGGFVDDDEGGDAQDIGMGGLWGQPYAPPVAAPPDAFGGVAPAAGGYTAGPASAAPASNSSGGLLGLLPVSDNARESLLAAGLGMLSSKSPFIGSAIGEGGLAGLQTYRQGRASEQAHALKEQSVAAQANRLAQQAASAAEALKFRTRQQDEVERHNRAVEAKAAAGAESEYASRAEQAAKYGLDPDSDAGRAYILTGRLPREDQQRLTATDKKAILEADEAVNSTMGAITSLERAKQLSKTAYDGATANERAWLTSQWGDPAGNDTRELKQTVTEGALQQLKAIFGGMPTEGERKVLLEVQGSAELPREVRERIYDRAIGLAKRRLEFNKSRADDLRGGTFYKPEGGGVPPPETKGPPPAAIEQLKAAPTPEMKKKFDDVFGVGAADKALGGV